MNNNVSHPAHYTQGPVHPACGEVVECITITKHHNFNVGNAIKYLWRADHKADALEDLAKAAQYIQFEIDRRKYEAARREPTLFSDDKTETVTIEPDLSPFKITGARIQPDPFGVNRKSGHTHTGGFAFDVSPSFKSFLSAMLNADEPDDEGHDEPDDDAEALDDSNSHVCMDGTRVPGKFCAGRALADMLGLEVSTDYPGRAGN